MARFDVDQLRREIEALIRDYPQLTEDETLRADMIDAETDINEALTLLVRDIKLSEALVMGITEERKQWALRRDRLEHRIDVLRELVLKVMQSGDLKKLLLPVATLVQSASQPTIVGEPDAATLPDEFVRIKREANRSAILEALKAHRSIPGLSLSNSPPHLVIKVR